MIEKLILKNYRNLRLDEGLTFDPLTIFVGPNGSGKTNLLRVLRFLQDAWMGVEGERRGVTRFESALASCGAGRMLDRALGNPAVVTVEAHFRLQPEWRHRFSLDLDVKGENTVSVRREAMERWRQEDPPPSAPPPGVELGKRRIGGRRDRDYPLSGAAYYVADLAERRVFVTRVRSNAVASAKNNIELIANIPANDLAVRGIQRRLEEESDIPLKEFPVFEGNRLIEDFVREWALYDASLFDTDTIRGSSPEIGPSDRRLTPSGDNLARVLFNLGQDNINLADEIQQAMTELFPETRSLRPSVLGRVSLTLEWYLRGIAKPFFLDEMSEGTIRMLCWAAILFSPEIPRLLIIEEPEVSLHPAWLQVLAGWIRAAARRTQVIVSTHSPDLLDFFSDDVESVRVFEKDPGNSLYSRVRPLTKADVAEKVSEGWKLGDLYRVGDPQVGGWPW